MEICNGKITNICKDGITVFVPYCNWDRLVLRQYDAAQVGLPDSRTISPEQRRKAYALMGEIAAWAGYSTEEVKLIHKREFIDNHLQGLQRTLFSLSDCDMTTAREFISYLIDFILTFDVPTSRPLAELCEDIHQYVWHCLVHKKCAICGQKAIFHRVGSVGMKGVPLCRMHRMEARRIGDDQLMSEFHLEAIEADEQIANVYKLKSKTV